ncbi:glycosyltransferase family 4 protein [Aliiruegeria sabulilitoris]|uniref:glycosyltransferase family 4 protein n=1 Tax=Aliiruegeria sabulilitoris TaxID=1510458 RepID=UPI0008298680|nr:glycosyltransferase family 4 protein [Aliiruegeria sabulilitoris]NDR55635.1 glycosyltransferase family 4 protein [Pseudoruegeria sp. M32A2M]
MTAPAAFAIPGDITTLTGGYLYERHLLEHLRAAGHDMQHIVLAESFPDPSAREMEEAVTALAALPSDQPLILDGLVFGAIDTAGLAQVSAPVIAMIHHPLALESGLSEARREHLYRTERDNLRLAAHVLVPSPHTQSILVDRYEVDPDRITVLRPGVAPAVGRSEPIDPPLILSVGILHPRKGHDVLIEALASLRDFDWTAVIVGSAWDPEHAEVLAQQLAKLDFGGRIRLAGRVTLEELQRLYRAASVFALATRYEGYGIVFDEAMSYGLPAISCDTGAVRETLPASASLLVPPDNAMAFADALQRILEDKELRTRLAAAALQAGKAQPGWPQQTEIASKLINQLAPQAGNGF